MTIPTHFVLQWHITERCNLRCRHCYQDRDKIPPDLTLDQLFYIFENFLFLIKKWKIDSSNKVSLNITGGEPFFRKDFFQFVEKIGEYSHLFRWHIMSNGSLLTEKDVLRLKKANLAGYQVSLEGMEKNNDEIRGKGSFKKTFRAIKLLVNEGIPTLVSFTLTRKNIKDIPALVRLCDRLGVSIIGARRLISRGEGEKLRMHMLQPKELKVFYLNVKKINSKLVERKRKLRVVLGCESAIFAEEILADPLAGMRLNSCGVTEGICLNIMVNGDVLPCRRLPIVVGNALKETLYDVYYSRKLQEFRDLDKLHPFCRACSNFVNCFGGAKCVTYAYTGKWDIPDVQCWRAYKKLNQPLFI